MEDVEVPPPPPTEDEARYRPPPKRKSRDEQLWDIRESLCKARRNLAEVTPARDFFVNSAVAETDREVPFEVVATILEAALGRAETAENVRGNPPRFDGKAFLKKLGVSLTDAESITWTPDLIRRGLSIYAGYAQEPAEQFIEAVRTDLDERAEEAGRTIRRLECEEAAQVRRLDSGIARRQAAKLLPADGRDERIANVTCTICSHRRFTNPNGSKPVVTGKRYLCRQWRM